MNKPEILETNTIAETDWLKFNQITYKDYKNQVHKWDSVERKRCNGAVAIIATFKNSNKLILIKQYRPPTNKYVIEFPAGLIDEGYSVEETAIKELIEETGYTGVIEKVYPASYSSPGLTGESVFMAIVSVDEDAEINQNVKQQLEGTEDIETIIVPLKDLSATLADFEKQGNVLDAKLANFAISQTFLLD